MSCLLKEVPAETNRSTMSITHDDWALDVASVVVVVKKCGLSPAWQGCRRSPVRMHHCLEIRLCRQGKILYIGIRSCSNLDGQMHRLRIAVMACDRL
jgi:hypothetical protein